MMIFAAGAGISLGVFGLLGAGGSRRFWAAAAGAAGAFAAAVLVASGLFDGRNLAVTFLFWLLAGAAPAAFAVKFRRLSPQVFAAFAASDLAVAAALTVHRQQTLSWAVPAAGSWKAAGVVMAAAALIRLAGPLLAADAIEGPAVEKLRSASAADGAFTVLGWWQGAFLAGWVGASGKTALVIGGLMLWALSCFAQSARLPALCLAGGTVAMAAGFGASHLAVAAVAAAGAAFAGGETVVSLWGMAGLPLSVIAIAVAADAGPWTPLWAAALPLCLAALAFRAGVRAPGARAGVTPPAALAAGAVAATAVDSPAVVAWLLYALAAAALFLAATTRTAQGTRGEQFPDPAPFRPGAVWPGAALVLAAALVSVRLAAEGLRSGFL